MQPHGLLAIAEFESAAEGRAALKNLAYRRFKDGILYLEKGPKGLFTGSAPVLPPTSAGNTGVEAKISSLDLKDAPAADAASDNVTTLFVRNLSFNTNADGFTKAFQHLPGFMWARLKTKTDPKKPGQVLSMGFGFVGFKEPENAKYALGDMDGKSLDGHKLLVKMANRGADAGETTKKADEKKNKEAQGTKIVIKNLPFEVSKQDIRSLFGYVILLRITISSLP
jgi:multiple RNA-binding domain-containing protein 1